MMILNVIYETRKEWKKQLFKNIETYFKFIYNQKDDKKYKFHIF